MTSQSGAGGRKGLFVIFIGTAYAAALAIPVLSGKFVPLGNGDDLRGGAALMYGYSWPLTIPWSANIFLLIGILCYAANRLGAAIACSAIAVALGFTTPSVVEGAFADLRIGFFAWIFSFMILGVGAALEMFEQSRRGVDEMAT